MRGILSRKRMRGENMEQALRKEEKVVLALRSLYQQYGYQLYRMNKFEEYDFYAENKRFLVGKKIVTFTDTNGKLMALKPDVTLSIVKNLQIKPGQTKKVYYDENVYRAWGSNKEFQEIRQAGLECMGEIDAYAIGEVILLAAKSLPMIKEPFILTLSHMGFIAGLLEEACLSVTEKKQLLKALSYKNKKEILALCKEFAVTESITDAICSLATICGPIYKVLPEIKKISCNAKMDFAWQQLEEIRLILAGYGYEEQIHLDFSMTDDMAYYNGVIFKGFVLGIPNPVLSGGQYDHLMEKLGKKCGAIGFAVYLNLLEWLNEEKPGSGVDVFLTYRAGANPVTVAKAAKSLVEQGYSVRVEKELSPQICYGKAAYIDEEGGVRFGSND